MLGATIRSTRVWKRRSKREMRHGTRATSQNRIASATSCWRRGSFWKTRRAAPAGGENRSRVPMISYLHGTVKALEAGRLTLLVNGVGYEVHISLQTYYRLEGQREAALEIYTHVREDTL